MLRAEEEQKVANVVCNIRLKQLAVDRSILFVDLYTYKCVRLVKKYYFEIENL